MYAAAPNFSKTGSHSAVVKNDRPYRCIAGQASTARRPMIPTRSVGIIAVATRVAPKKTRSPGPAPAPRRRAEAASRVLAAATSAPRERRLPTGAELADQLLALGDNLLGDRR